jgi:hypothetical protein
MSTESNKEKLKEAATAMGFVEVTVHFRNAEGKTQSEMVKVLQLPIKKYRELSAALDDEIALAALYCDLAGRANDEKARRAWVEQLTPASHEKVIQTGKDINWDFFCSWVSRRQQTREALKGLPGLGNLPGRGGMEETSQVFELIARHNPELVKGLIEKVVSSIESQNTSSGSAAYPARAPGEGNQDLAVGNQQPPGK